MAYMALKKNLCEAIQCLLLLYYGYILFVEGSDVSGPVLYPSTFCTVDNAIEFKYGLSIPECIDECEKRKLCFSINYNRFNAVCVLRKEVAIPGNAEGPRRCFNIDVNDTSMRSNDSCSNRPCNDSDLCIPHKVRGQMSYSCKVIFCVLPPYIKNAEPRSTSPTPVGKTNAYACSSGFTAFGNATIECQTDGNWTETDFICHMNCPAIPIKTGANIVSRSTYRLTINTTVIYSCSLGYYNLSDSYIACNETGDWSHFECTPHCLQSDIPTVLHGSPTSGLFYTIHMTSTYSCNDGYYLSPGSAIVRCDRDGHWSTPDVECYKHCLTPVLSNAAIQTIPDIPFVNGSKVTFGCVSNYYAFPFGSEPYAVCTQTGVWAYEYECYKYCDSPPNAWDVTIRSVEPNPYTVESTATYRCKYALFARDQRKECQKNGEWTGQVKCCGFKCSTL